jgi:hypothetical protein
LRHERLGEAGIAASEVDDECLGGEWREEGDEVG